MTYPELHRYIIWTGRVYSIHTILTDPPHTHPFQEENTARTEDRGQTWDPLLVDFIRRDALVHLASRGISR